MKKDRIAAKAIASGNEVLKNAIFEQDPHEAKFCLNLANVYFRKALKKVPNSTDAKEGQAKIAKARGSIDITAPVSNPSFTENPVQEVHNHPSKKSNTMNEVSARFYYDLALSDQASGQQLVTSKKYDLADQAFQKASVNFQQAEYIQGPIIPQLKNSLNPSNDIGDAYRFYGEIFFAKYKLAKVRSEFYATRRESIESEWKDDIEGQNELHKAQLELEKAEANLQLIKRNRDNLSKSAGKDLRNQFNDAVLSASQARDRADVKVNAANKPHTEMIFKQPEEHLNNSHKDLLSAKCQFENAKTYYENTGSDKLKAVENQLNSINTEIAIKKLSDYIAIRTAQMNSEYGIHNFFASITTGKDAKTKITAAQQIIEKLTKPKLKVKLNQDQFNALHESRLGETFKEVTALCPYLWLKQKPEEPNSSCFSFLNF